MVFFRKVDLETAIVFRTIAISCVSLTVLAIPAIAQCPDGTPPPCARPPRPEARSPRVGVASIRVLASTPVAGTTLTWRDLEKGVPLHVVVEHAVQRVPPGQVPVLAAFVNLTPDATHRGYQRVLEARVITARPTQRGLNWVLTTEHVRQKRITVAIHVAFAAAADTALTSARALKLSYDWGASITLEFPVADSSDAAFAPALAALATDTGQRHARDPGDYLQSLSNERLLLAVRAMEAPGVSPLACRNFIDAPQQKRDALGRSRRLSNGFEGSGLTLRRSADTLALGERHRSGMS
jgi:hypothetical protein